MEPRHFIVRALNQKLCQINNQFNTKYKKLHNKDFYDVAIDSAAL